METMDDKLILWLNTQLEARGWTHRELARRAKTSHTAVSSVLAGQRRAGWDFCVAIAKALGERPERVFRMARLLPALPQIEEETEETITLLSNLPPEMRAVAINILRSMQTQPPQFQLAERPTPYQSAPSLTLDQTPFDLMAEFPELHNLVADARNQLSEQAFHALIYNIQILASQNDRDQFGAMYRRLSELFDRLDL